MQRIKFRFKACGLLRGKNTAKSITSLSLFKITLELSFFFQNKQMQLCIVVVFVFLFFTKNTHELPAKDYE